MVFVLGKRFPRQADVTTHTNFLSTLGARGFSCAVSDFGHVFIVTCAHMGAVERDQPATTESSTW